MVNGIFTPPHQKFNQAPINPMEVIAEERQKASFPVREMTHYLDGGPAETELKERFMQELERDPFWKIDDYADISLAEIRERTMQKAKIVVHHLANEPVEVFRKRMALISIAEPAFWTRLGVHYGLFIGALQSQATPTQFSYWVSKGALALNGVIGCFAMTEMGHGSNVAGLETTATFDEAADEFIIHTPTLTGTKVWIGGAAHTVTHAAVFAQLIVKGQVHGVKCFIVQLRDTATFNLKPGINIGDMGKKMGRDGIDNGWIQFTNVRIPRSQMLMKHTKVSRDGTVTEPPLAQLTYGALIQGRVAMVVDSGNTAKKALTIALRYAAVRRQFAAKPDGPESKLLDFPIHQYRLLPLLSQCFAMHFTGVVMDKMYVDLTRDLESAQPGQNMDNILEALKETHSTSAGLKAFCTWTCLNIIEQCRQSLGGNGYSEYSGLSRMSNDFAVQCTWEGDNTILALQAGRYLIGCFRDVRKGKKLPPGVGYLNQLPSILTKKCPYTRPEELSSPSCLQEAFNVVCANVVKKVAENFQQMVKGGMKPDEAFEQCSAERFFAAKIHTLGYIFSKFSEGISSAPPSLKPVLVNLCSLYGVYTVVENAGVFLQYHYFNSEQMDILTQQVNNLCQIIRKDAIPLVDSFNLSDYIINSPMGRFDGNIYQAYFDRIRRANPPKPHPYFESLVKPLLTRSMAVEEAPEIGE